VRGHLLKTTTKKTKTKNNCIAWWGCEWAWNHGSYGLHLHSWWKAIWRDFKSCSWMFIPNTV